jgi:hypothetical protein
MPVQTKSTLGIIALCMIISASMMLSSCSTMNALSSQNPHYRLSLVKAGTSAKVDKVKDNARSASAIAPISHGSLVFYQSDEQLKALTDLLKSDVKQIEKQEKKTNPTGYKNLKKINISKLVNQMAIPGAKTSTAKLSSVSAVNDQQYDLMRDPKGLFVIWIILLGAAALLLVLSISTSIFLLFGFIVAVAWLIFFTLWLFSITGVPERVS